jgi:rare lipoprotein A
MQIGIEFACHCQEIVAMPSFHRDDVVEHIYILDESGEYRSPGATRSQFFDTNPDKETNITMEITPTGNTGNGLSAKDGIRASARKASINFSEVLTASLETQSAASAPAKPESPPIKPAPAKNEPIEYVVKPGDTLWKIGKQMFKRDPFQIARDNGIANPNLIRPGQKLIINPAPPQPAPPSVSGEVTASWYGPEHHNKLTASGQRFDMNKNTLAHRTLPIGTKVRLVNPDNGKSAEGVVNDRGPYIKGRDVDVSYAMAKQLGFVKKGVTKLDIETI